ncbi:MAG: hypothetical protein KGI92_00975 [Alphaproteobacteria bacterium]|nr:hypothetical protein [Alphaproteobacteria bacterium]
MLSWRIDRPTTPQLAAWLVAATVLGAAPATAQPIQLTPSPTPPPAAPSSVAPPQSLEGGDQIQVSPLQPVDTSWTGLLGPDKGGFPHDMWNGANRGFVVAALPQLQPATSPELTSLARRLLLSNAAAPAPAGTANDAAAGARLLAERIDRIYALGFVRDGLALIESLPDTAVTDAIDRDRIELRFATNDTTGACNDVTARIDRYAGAWWARALIACQALAGDFGKASLGQGLLADQKAPADPEFDALIQLLSEHGAARVARLGDPTPLRMTLLAAAKRPLPVEAIAVADPAALAGYAGNDSVPADDRLAAAERAEALGVLPPAALAALYGAINFKPEELERARRSIRPPTTPRDRALLYTRAKFGTHFAVRMAAIEALAAEAEKRGVFVPEAGVLAPTLADIPVAGADSKFAGVAARILLAAGDADAAKPWVSAASDKATLLLSLIATPGVPRIEAGIARDAAAAAGDAAAGPRAGLLYVVLAALGVDPATLADLTPSALTAPATPGALPNAALWDEQARAANNAQLGSTVLATILIAESDGRLTSESLLLGRAIAGLRAVGLDGDAHALALEAALDAGI